MRTALTLAFWRNGQSKVVAGPHVAIDQQIADFKKIAAHRENATLAELQLWISDAGITKRMKFREPKVEETTTETVVEADRLAQEKADLETAEKERLARTTPDPKSKSKK